MVSPSEVSTYVQRKPDDNEDAEGDWHEIEESIRDWHEMGEVTHMRRGLTLLVAPATLRGLARGYQR